MHLVSEGAICNCSMKYVFIKIVKNSLENTCTGVSFNKDSGTGVFFWILIQDIQRRTNKDQVSRLARKQELGQRNCMF